MPRVGIAGFLHESNTFLSVPTTYEHFASCSLTRGDALVKRWTGTHHELGGFLAGASQHGLDAVPLLATFAVPSGTITAEAYERIAGEMLDCLRAALPLDGLLLALHGATVSTDFPDADGELLTRIRAVTGPELPIIVTYDLHANVSPAMISGCQAAIAYRSNPHLDQADRGAEAAHLLARVIRGEVRPLQALETPPLLIRISKQYTAEQPSKSLYDDLQEVLTWPGILTASVTMGFYYSDVAEMGAAFFATADGDLDLAQRAARWMADRAWERRADFAGTLPGPAKAVAYAAKSARTPVVLMDVGDNVGGGSPGDSTVLLAEVLAQGAPGALVVLYDPESVAACVAAGVRSDVEILAGGKTDSLHGDPVPIRGRVRTLSDGCFTETQVRHGGWSENDQGVTAVVETAEQHTIVLTSRRMAPMSLEQILSAGIHPERKRILIVKGVVAPRAAYAPVAAEIVVVDSPGVTSDNPASFTYRHRRKDMYPS
ncbi:MAG: M81 family metallopeptidase [Bryobacteraceae bacterium]